MDKVPEAEDVLWTVENNIYQVDYFLSAKHTSSYFDEQGQWLETETEIAVDELPHKVLQTLRTKMGEYEILDIELVATRAGKILYEVDLEKDGKTYDILFDQEGKILRKKI
ncbi:Putative beta-lactamase-inhibitor-like, PepSY-like [Maribacter sedimenticola]|uniref:Beta-lactamase-inhibitor-like, PepSY-like n=2 Tax=Flavobacteriaceae TaxID=49546 RepID=A0ABY1SFI2_9FLAO|nr:putative PepSY-like beta-lactamase-inhibitor [Maribacter sp. MAR_2009_72]SNR39553.1 Putative beta-lactamase-inhibitor-like, PepSY-like [Maribacter sedimenticola]